MSPYAESALRCREPHVDLAAVVVRGEAAQVRFVTNVMRSARHRQTQQKWEWNDFIDIVALPVAAVYCDVIITEKQWVHRMRQGKVDQQYNTVLLDDTAALVEVLVNASVT